jgi:hypothetical protein
MAHLGQALAGLVIAVGLVGLASCGGSSDDATSTTSSDTPTSSTASATSASTTIAPSSETSGTSPSSATSATSSAPRPTTEDLEAAIEADIEARFPQVGSGVADCQASGELADWQPVLCSFLPDQPVEFGGVYVSMLDDGRYAWDLGRCCDAGPNVEEYPTGLFCRDLVEPPPGVGPDRWPPEYDHLSYGLAMYYWLTEGRPDRMDADLNGRPCETVYPAGEINDFWDSAGTLDHRS